MKSLGAQIKQLAALLDTTDLTDWEQDFVASVYHRSKGGTDTRSLTPKQTDTVDRIYSKHFGD